MPTGEIEVVIEDILDVAAPKRRFEVSPRVLVSAMLFTGPKNVCLNLMSDYHIRTEAIEKVNNVLISQANSRLLRH